MQSGYSVECIFGIDNGEDYFLSSQSGRNLYLVFSQNVKMNCTHMGLLIQVTRDLCTTYRRPFLCFQMGQKHHNTSNSEYAATQSIWSHATPVLFISFLRKILDIEENININFFETTSQIGVILKMGDDKIIKCLILVTI